MSAVLVIRPSSMGDIVYALAILGDIERHRPELAVDWVAERGFVPLVSLAAGVHRVIPFALRRWRKAPFRTSTWREIGAFRHDLRHSRYAAILDLQEQVKGAVIARTARGRRHGFDRASVREPIATLGHDVHHHVPRGQHFVERARRLAGQALGYVPEGPPRWRFATPRDTAAVPAGRYVTILQATSRAEKLWPEERWRELIRHFSRAGLATILPWGSADEEARSRRLAADIEGTIVPGWLSLPDAAAVLERGELTVGVDTGFTHLSAALGTPTVALFPATDPVLHGVAATGAHGVDLGDGRVQPGVDEVIDAAGRLLRAAPRC